MELKINIYEDRFCRKLKDTKTANDFDLSTAVCEDVLNVINIDMFDGGLDALSDDALKTLALSLIKNGFPFFKDLIQELFELTDDEIRHTKIDDMVTIIKDITKYSINKLKNIATKNKGKN